MLKKLIIAAVIAVLTVSLLAGCSAKSITEQFSSAVEKTSTIRKASNSFDFTINAGLNNSKLSPEEKEMYKPYSNIKGSFTGRFDKDNNISYTEGTIFVNGAGFNTKIYSKDNKSLILLPYFNKYLVINNASKDTSATGKTGQAAMKNIMKSFNEIATKDNLKETGKSKISIGNSQTDTTGFEISLSDSDAKKLIGEVISALLSDGIKDQIAASAESSQGAKNDTEIKDALNTFTEEVKKGLDQASIQSFIYKGAFDKNSYIVDDSASTSIIVGLPNSENIRFNLSVSTKTWDIGKDVSVEMPVTDSSNSITPEQLYENMPRIYSGFDNTVQ